MLVPNGPERPSPSPNHLRPSAAKKGRGGRRPGAGAPRGNLNGLKTGLYSKQLARVGLIMAANPETRQALLTLAQRHQLKQKEAEQVAAIFFARMLERGVKISSDQQRQALKDFKDSIDRI